MYHGSQRGWIEIIAGVMFSGKSEELIRRVRSATIARNRVQVFKSRLDDRYGNASAVMSHDGTTLAGTDTDFRGEPFAAMPALMAIAEIVDKLYAVCVVCGDPACRNQRLVDNRPAPYDSPTILVGGRESYEARCRHCHVVPRADAAQTKLPLSS